MITTSTPDQILFHYTSLDAFYQIMKGVTPLDSQITFWASHVMFMNDPREYMFLINEIARKLREEELFQEADTIKNIADSFSSEVQILDIMNGIPAVFSLSDKKDKLPMWQTYGQNGKGIAIGFRRQELEALGGWNLFQCEYHKPETLNNRINTDKISACYQSDEKGNSHTDLISLNRVIADRIFIKNSAYEHEGEWRLSKNDQLNYKYREKNGLLIPYLELNIPVTMIKEVWIGPTTYPRLSEMSIQMFLHSLQIDYRIYKSSIPYAIL